ncbi:MAG TPA: NCS2 family permease [Terriglobales bacterium]|nr:NCS2 family permease [Terriglobales bacterium]
MPASTTTIDKSRKPRRDSLLERWFKLSENESTVRQEVVGGVTTFITMAYIVVVNAQILSQAGMPVEGVVFATCVSAAAATLVMGLYANYPIALAPGMSLNAYFTYSVCLGMHVPWQTALGVVFISGMVFILITVTRVREQIVNGIPECLKHSTAAGIGIFIAFIGMRNAGLVVSNPATFVSLGNFSDHGVQAACFGILLTAALIARKVHGSVLLGIVGTMLFGAVRGSVHWPQALISMPHPSGTLLRLDLRGAVHLGLFEIIFAFLFVDLFDNVGTLMGVCEQAGFVQDGKIPRVGRILLADGVGTVLGSLTGTSTVTSYVESAAGVAAGARTGLSNVVVAALFLLALFFSPLATSIPAFATAPALIVVGGLMMQSVARIDWPDFSEAFPAFITAVSMPLTFSIATGLSFGVITYTAVKVVARRGCEVSTLIWVLSLVFVLRDVYLALR